MQASQLNKDIFVLPVQEDFLVYSPLNGISALINRVAVNELIDQLKLISQNKGNINSKLYNLAKDSLRSPVQLPVRRTGSLNPEFLGIIPTRSCNGSCNYCDFEAETASIGKMSFAMAAGVVEWYVGLMEEQKRNIAEIHFFGGEPMVARDVIEVVVQRARLLCNEKDLIPYFEISTNGQYSAADALFLGNYFNKVVLSLDGFSEIQNLHRPLKGNKSSFENAVETANIVGNSSAELCIRCCISNRNVLMMEEITRWFCENFRLSAINFEILCRTDKTSALELYPPDPVDFAVHFQKARVIANQFGVDVVYASDISILPQISSCPVGKDAAILSPDGRLSNCYLMPERWQEAGLDLDFGVFSNHSTLQIEKSKLKNIRDMVEEKHRCENCFCKWSCAGGCYVGNTYPGCSQEYDDFCKQTRLISLFSLLEGLDMLSRINHMMDSTQDMQKILQQKSDRYNALTF
jgi:uncharacterized protein